MDYIIPDVSTLKRIRSLSLLSNDRLIALANQLRVFTARKGDLLIEKGSIESSSLYILNGKVSLIAADDRTKQIELVDGDELNQIAQLRPCIYDVQAQENLRYIKINKQQLVEFAQVSDAVSGDISVHSLRDSDDEHTHSIIYDIYRNIMCNDVQLPNLPAVANDITELYQNQIVDAGRLAKVLLAYPAVSDKLVRGATKNQDVSNKSPEQVMLGVATRLGTKSAYYLIMTHIINQLYVSQPAALAEKLKPYREHSLNVAAISRSLAKTQTAFSSDRAMLAGMIHAVGSLVIVDFLFHNGEDFALDSEEINHATLTLRQEFTSLLLRRWKIAEDVALAAESCEDWFRNPSDELDLCDIVLVANYHSCLSTDRAASLPPISAIPAMQKLKMTPAESIELIKRSNFEKEKIEKLIG
jgi:HD-like signal output (HDOD) protein